MKIITNKAIYVQKNDIVYIIDKDIEMPISIYIKLFGKGKVIIDDSNKYDFVKFEEADEIEFFKELDWLIDYDSVKDLSYDEAMELRQNIVDYRNQIADQFNAMPYKERKENMEMMTKYDLLYFKICSLATILDFKLGRLKITLPEGIDYPVPIQKETKIKKLVKKIFSKKE